MPNRIVRSAILDSERYHSVDLRARLAFHELLLCADDYGLVPVSSLYLRRHTTALADSDPKIVAQVLSSLADHDLIRMYEVDGGRFAYIPRFGNHPRARKPAWPLPPANIGGNEIKELIEKLRSTRYSHAKQVHSECSARAPETETETETETEEKEVHRMSVPRAAQKPDETAFALAGASAPPRASRTVKTLELETQLPAITIPIVGNGSDEYPVSAAFAEELGRCFPAVDVDQTLREIRAWNVANPSRRKTATGVRKHITAWFQREQNR
jgi:hypothetical protein